MRSMHRIAIAIILLIAGISAFGSPPGPCSLTSTVTDAKVSIAITNGRTSFHEGEIIPLSLSFTSTADKRYWANDRTYDRSGRLDMESYCVEPAVRDPLEDYFRDDCYLGGGGFVRQLTQKPFTATAELNEWRQPGPGHYRLYVVSSRVWRPPDPDESTPSDPVTITLRSNTIEFDVIKADADWQAEQLESATTAYQNPTADRVTEAARRLRFLNTKESPETLARLFWGLNDQPGGWDLMFGLFGSPYRLEAIAAMQRGINDPGQAITQDFLRTLTKLQINADSAWDPPTCDPAHPGVCQEYWQKRRAHERELMQAAIADTTAALPRKTGRARALTVQALAVSSELLNTASAAQMRKQLAAAWGDLPERNKLELIRYRWPLIAGPEMLPNLREFVAGSAPPIRTEPAMARDAALKHIFELNPGEGRALILRDLRDPEAQPSISLAKLLSADELQPIVQEAVKRIEKDEARDLDYHLLEVFGDPSALGVVKRVFTDKLDRGTCDPQAAMLRYFLRLDREFGSKMVEASLAARNATDCYQVLLEDLGKSLQEVEQVAISALDDDDLEVARNAALALGRWGTVKSEPSLWARLHRFHEQWKNREGELRVTPGYESSIGRATALESALVNSIATGRNWICDPQKLEHLRDLASPRQQMQITLWSKLWEQGYVLITPRYNPDNQLSFGVLQYPELDEDQFRTKLSQMPKGIKLQFQIWKPGQVSTPVSMEKQEAVFRSLKGYAAQFGIYIEQKRDP